MSREKDPGARKAYSIVRQIGKGSYGEVFLVTTDRKKKYVMKNIKLTSASAKERLGAEQEASLLSRLKHPNIVSYKESFQDRSGVLHIIMGYCEGGDLCTRLKAYNNTLLPETQVVEWFVQISLALQYLHERNILHRDLKTQNIFLSRNDIIKVGDLGIARVLDGSCDLAHTVIGTPYYMSPELFANQPYNHKSDIWALGCCVYEMASLKHAFSAHNINALMYKIIQGKVPPLPSQYSTQLTDLVQHMMARQAEERPDVHEILRMTFIRKHIKMFLNRASSHKSRPPERPPVKVRQEGDVKAEDVEVASVSKVEEKTPNIMHDSPSDKEREKPLINIHQVKHCTCDDISSPSPRPPSSDQEYNGAPKHRNNDKVPRPLPPDPTSQRQKNGSISSARQRRRRSKQLESHGKIILKSHSSTDLDVVEESSRNELVGRNEPDGHRIAGPGVEPDYAPLEGVSDDAPLEGVSDDVPLKGVSDDAPLEGVSDDAPLERGSDDAPLERGSDDAPLERGSDDAPLEGGPDDAPLEGDPSSDEVDEYFTLLNCTLHLPEQDTPPPLQSGPVEKTSLFPSGRLANRIKALRQECERELGEALVQQVHKHLTLADPEEAEEDLKVMLGAENFETFAAKLHQLKLCEDSLFSH